MKMYDGGVSLFLILGAAALIGWGVNRGADAIVDDKPAPAAQVQHFGCKSWVTEPMVGAGLAGKTKSTCVDDGRVS